MNEVVVNGTVAFDYLSTQTIEQLEQGIWHHKGKMAQSIIEIGARLIVAKAKLNHGEWGKWLEEKIEISHRTANNWMKVATEFGNTDSQAISNLEGTKIIMLLDVPVEMRDNFMEQNDLKNMTTREMKQAIKDLKNIEVDNERDYKVYNVKVSDLKDFPNHEKYFPNLIGRQWLSFLNSIERNGVLDPIHITRDNVIVGGHQRVRACRDLGIETIPATYFYYDKNKKLTYDEQVKTVMCIDNCRRGQYELSNNARIMFGLQEGEARNPQDIINENINKIHITQEERLLIIDILEMGKKLRTVREEMELEEFKVYLKQELDTTLPIAVKMMHVAEEFGNTDSQSLSDLELGMIMEVLMF
ncbi:DUF3102 domain-containing protein [Zhenhengia yiwuensis]|uniref:DUF3102 domain-containing protein n=1 Tax=Zhenhengia yiwuensis TaxID=2763666 RepID=A0A926EN24_9FIRM|nr:DUF3102 domain-containing protein [Zhenhengia yiwuensis]MBC8581460.1 DUF3102 domain-containing protein [Zhenhengia yiwuensis]